MKVFQNLIRSQPGVLVLLALFAVLSADPVVCDAKGYLLFTTSLFNPSKRCGRAVVIEYLGVTHDNFERIAKFRNIRTIPSAWATNKYARIAIVSDDSCRGFNQKSDRLFIFALRGHRIEVRKINLALMGGLNSLWFGGSLRHPHTLSAVTISGRTHAALKARYFHCDIKTGKTMEVPWARASIPYLDGIGLQTIRYDIAPWATRGPVAQASGSLMDEISYKEWFLKSRMPMLRLPHPPPPSMIPPQAASQAKVYGNILGNVALDIKYGLSKNTYNHRLLVYRQAAGKWSGLNIPYHHIAVQAFPNYFVVYHLQMSGKDHYRGFRSAIIFSDASGYNATISRRHAFEILWAGKHRVLVYSMFSRVYLYRVLGGFVGKKPLITFPRRVPGTYNVPFAVFPVSHKPKLYLKPAPATSPAKTRAKVQ